MQLSIVIAAWNGNALLRQCLASLVKQTDRADTEIIVASNFAVSETEGDIPLKLLLLDEKATVPEIRRDGIALAKGKIVALVEDHCIFDSNWCEEIKKAHESPNVCIGGSVENASVDKALDWAVYFYDYGKYMLPNAAGTAKSLSGINTSYKRKTLEELEEVYRNGFFESTINEELRKRGHQLMMAPAAVVYHNKSYEMKHAVEHSYHLARSYAALRVSNISMPKRIFFGAVSFVLPVLLPVRIVLNTFRKGRNILPMFSAFPFIVLLTLVWSFGEFCGYLFGEGKSSAAWR
ncbi:MAG: glycosyltransferase [Pyrinomonadaceae bacterium]